MKTTKRLMAALAASGLLCACGGSSGSYSSKIKENGSEEVITITADNASLDNDSVNDMEIQNGDELVVDGDLSKGAVTVTVKNKGAEESAKPAIEWEFEGQGTTEYMDIEPGSYTVTCKVTKEGATGTLTVTKKPGPVNTGADESTQNPIMNFVGNYENDPYSILVEPNGMQESSFTVQMKTSDSEYTEWHMTGVLDTSSLTVDYTDGTKKKVVMNGSVTESETFEYQDGTGSFRFDGGSGLKWTDNKEHTADSLEFEYKN